MGKRKHKETEGLTGDEAARVLAKIYRDRYPEKGRARSLVGNALQSGKLIRPVDCSKCEFKAFRPSVLIEAHHEDYSKPLEIQWLCPWCHRRRHAQLRAAKKVGATK